jgi:ATP-dependent Clp protease ATP-binding subunit ClpC
MNPIINLSAPRAREAHLGKEIGRNGFLGLVLIGSGFAVAAIAVSIVKGPHILIGFLASGALACYLPAVWWKRQLSVLPATGTALADRLSVDVLVRLKAGMELQPKSVWTALKSDWQALFFTHHLLLTDELVEEQLSTDPAVLQQALAVASNLADEHKTATIELGFVVAGLLMTAPNVQQLLVKFENKPEDIKAIADWLGRNVGADPFNTKASYGGVGRDWAFGFTPLLDRLGHNISLAVSGQNLRFDWLARSAGVMAIETAFDNHASAIALIGPDGIGKTNTVYALAQRMIQGSTTPSLAYHQIISLNATDITSQAHGTGDLEQIMVSVVNEASKAGHIILFFDNAELFLADAAGSFDATNILLSIIEARSVPIILAMAPHDYQSLKTQNQSLAGLLTPVVLQEPPEADVMRILEDTCGALESHFEVLVAYEALREAYMLSGRYEQDEAYPGKAIKLLEQSANHAENSIVTKRSVQQAIEQTRGVKTGNAAPAEADALLHLEDRIHERMINQTHAVEVVASSLRRARAGVTNPKRPIGSFLFLGPTGVGKTELAKAIAATYFGAEGNMIRLDMSEYQQPDDVQRLLSTGVGDNQSLLMQVRQQPFSVVLLDEVEKSHPNILNLLLQMLDEGQLTDSSGRAASFKDCVIIATSNAGADTIRARIEAGQSLESFSTQFSDELINSGQFKPELLNRFDEMVLFRPLNAAELAQVVTLMLKEVNETLKHQNISVELTPAAIQKIVQQGYDPRLGARPMRRTLQRAVEDTIAELILKRQAKPGDHVILDAPNLKI